MSDNQFYDHNVTTTSYQVLCVKRDFEVLFLDTQTVVTQTMDGQGFVAWQIANFMQRANTHGISVSHEVYQTLKDIAKFESKDHRHYFKHFHDHNDNQYLRVEFQILSKVARQEANYEKDQTKALEQIAKNTAGACV